MSNAQNRPIIPILKFRQWLDVWDSFNFDDVSQGQKPQQDIYMFSMSASNLRSYSDVYKRERTPSKEEGIQRLRDENRTDRIRRFVKFGYPYGDLKEAQQTQDKESLKKPGWLPTAIVINLLNPHDIRKGKSLNPEHAATFIDYHGAGGLQLPNLNLMNDEDLRPFEVIDGQHRLWAFSSDSDLPSDFELPVVAFHGLDIAWQAYLFWSINVSPKKINPSHAFDLYPLLRNQDWLEQTGDLNVYREARSQEITEWLYKHPDSAWHNRINMLGERGAGRVSQAAWVRSLTSAFFGTGRGVARKGLFQANLDQTNEPLRWSRVQQIALILKFWLVLKNHIEGSTDIDWIQSYTSKNKQAFTDPSSMLNQDMGIRAVHAVANDILYTNAKSWGLADWYVDLEKGTDTSEDHITATLSAIENTDFYGKLELLASKIYKFDWRSLNGPEIKDNRNLELLKRAYRGSGRSVRNQC